MSQYETLHIEASGPVAHCLLNRPDRRNALNPAMISELTDFFGRAVAQAGYRVVVLRGSAGFFCAGADLAWMKDSSTYSHEQNLEDAHRLYDVFAAVNASPCLSIACVEGGAYGGGIGLIACCDMALGPPDCRFSLSELRLGLSPATISSFVVARIGISQARRLMLSALPFDAPEALSIGLLHELCEADQLEARLSRLIEASLQCGPVALRRTKELLLSEQAEQAALREQSAALIAELRTSAEGQEGLAAYFEKRQAGWLTS